MVAEEDSISSNTEGKSREVSHMSTSGCQELLVGGLTPSEKYDFVNWDDEIPNINGKMKN